MGIAEPEAEVPAVGRMPVYMRVGDGQEYEIGALIPEAGDLVITPDGTATVQVSLIMPRLLRAAADKFEGVG
jgi:hypothetical protein